MKIRNLAIANFKAIDQIDLQNLKDVIVIAGPNGCGKSTIFDAIRFWKTTIGTYQRDEMRSWLSELGISDEQNAFLKAHQHKDEPFSVRITIELSSEEQLVLFERAETLLAFYYFKTQSSNSQMMPPLLSIQNLELNAEFKNRKENILAQVATSIHSIKNLPDGNLLTGTVEVGVNGDISVDAPLALQLVLSVFVPDTIGIIDYYGPQRTFGRENVKAIDLKIDQQREFARANSALYNTATKYSSVKSELATSFVKRLISKSAGEDLDSNDLEHSVIELFDLFIPGKSFDGIRPTRSGELTFDVQTAAGPHDISDLSSGEKELIYGYLQLRGLSRSVILIDEPELHLNPRLTDGLPDFYYRHIGKAKDNQLWLVTHSDNILRQSMDVEGFDVFHMQTVGTYPENSPQLVEVSAKNDLNRAIIDLVGDLAAYRPGGKLVILEGGGDTEFDLEFISRLFPEFTLRVNLLSSGSRRKVRALHDVLERLGKERELFSGVYSIVDNDGVVDEAAVDNDKIFQWESYHIENYLLEPSFIRDVLIDNFVDQSYELSSIMTMLKAAAETTMDSLLRHEMERYARGTLNSLIKVSTSRDIPFSSSELGGTIRLSLDRIAEAAHTTLDPESLRQKSREVEQSLSRSLENGDWIKEFRGRDVLKALAAQLNLPTLRYESLRNQILGKMRMAQFQPPAVKQVLSRIAILERAAGVSTLAGPNDTVAS